ncbi:GEVED domain-containing protein, partial [Flavobacterium sp. LBUM151]
MRHKIIISTGTVTVSGSISTDSPTATSATIEFTGAGTLRVGGDFFSSGGGALTPSTGTVELNGTNQTFNNFSYYNLTLSGNGTKTFFTAAATSVTNSLIINSGVNADLGTFTHTANRLTLGSTQLLPSSWGSTTSNATNKSDVYFTATTGKINVSTSTCSNFTTVTPITNVSFNTLNKTTSASSTTAYEDYTGDTPTTVAKTQYYALTVKGNTAGDVNGYYSAFFDWNNDGDFDDAGEYFQVGTIRNSSGTDSKVTSVYIQIPSTAVTGTIKMRVIGRVGGYNTTPCAISGSTGQMEDYTITVQDACTGSAAPGNTLSTA